MSQVQNATSASYAAQWQYLQMLQSSGMAGSQQTGGSNSTQAFDPFAGLGGDLQSSSGGGATPPFNLGAMSALIDAQEQSGASGLSQHQQKVFGELDADRDGKVTGAELQSAFGPDNKAAADYVMSKLDKDGDGSISQSEFAAGTTRGAGGHHHHMHAGPPPGQGAQGAQDPFAALFGQTQGASSASTSNSDGSTTTTITYADGSKVSMTSAASAANSDSSVNSSTPSSMQANLLEQLIKMQSQLIQSVSAAMSSSLATI